MTIRELIIKLDKSGCDYDAEVYFVDGECMEILQIEQSDLYECLLIGEAKRRGDEYNIES